MARAFQRRGEDLALVGVEPGDDVLLIEPFYDSYAAAVALAGATRTAVPLVTDSNGWTVDTDALERAIGPRTRMLIVNSPHNPTGTVFDRDTMIRRLSRPGTARPGRSPSTS